MKGGYWISAYVSDLSALFLQSRYGGFTDCNDTSTSFRGQSTGRCVAIAYSFAAFLDFDYRIRSTVTLKMAYNKSRRV
jgi:hypothetical protein